MMSSWKIEDPYMEEMAIKYTRAPASFVGPRPMTAIDNDDIDELLLTFAAKIYNACDSDKPGSFSSTVLDRCAALFELDNNTIELSNHLGELSAHYPSRLIMPATQRVQPFIPPNATDNYIIPTVVQPPCPINRATLRHHWHGARMARCRTRFPVPVIRVADKYICRSATLAGLAEVYGRTTSRMLMNLAFGGSATAEIRKAAEAAAAIVAAADADSDDSDQEMLIDEAELERNMSLMDSTRSNDIKLLKYLKVSVITDLMVEMKKVKFGVNVTSSEKVDKENRYANFLLAVMPYPGCEFFRSYRDHAHSPQAITYNWSEEFNNAQIDIGDIAQHESFSGNETPRNGNEANGYVPLPINWSAYRDWNLKKLTLNYLRICLHHIKYSDHGMLVHCISGWDRTPLFISLLRITLWADGIIHQSLDALQMMYLTVAYDWYLFGHNLSDRLSKGEDIFFFCFNMLKYMGERDLCMMHRPLDPRHSNTSDSSNANSDTGAGPSGRMGNAGTGANDSNEGLPFDMEDLDLTSTLTKKKNGNHHASQGGKRNRTTSGCSSISEENVDSASMESLFIEMELSEAIRECPREDEENAPIYPLPTISSNMGKSSPMSVPRPSRQRAESTSSTGSWAMVTTTGSLSRQDQGVGHPSNHRGKRTEQDRHETPVLSSDDPLYAVLHTRNKRLVELREQFYLRYWSTIGRSKSHGALGNLKP